MSVPPDEIPPTPEDLPIALGPIASEPPPMEWLGGRAVVRETIDDLVDAMAADLRFHAISCARAWGGFHLALAPDAELHPFYRRLMYDPPLRDIPWDRTHVWVARDDAQGTGARTLGELIVEHADLPASHFHGLAIALPDATGRYERELVGALSERDPGHDRLDMVVLAARASRGAGGLPSRAPDSGPSLDRVLGLAGVDALVGVCEDGSTALTRRCVRGSRFVAITCVGRAHGAALGGGVARGGIDLPGGELRWYLDAPAAEAARDAFGRDRAGAHGDKRR